MTPWWLHVQNLFRIFSSILKLFVHICHNDLSIFTLILAWAVCRKSGESIRKMTGDTGTTTRYQEAIDSTDWMKWKLSIQKAGWIDLVRSMAGRGNWFDWWSPLVKTVLMANSYPLCLLLVLCLYVLGMGPTCPTCPRLFEAQIIRMSINQWTKGPLVLVCHVKKPKNGARRHSQCPGIFVGATWFWAKASYQICMDLDGSATSTVGGQRWNHIETERFLHVENQDHQRIANSWMRYAQPWNSPHLKHLENTTGEHNWTWKVLRSFPTGTTVAKTFGWTGLTVFLSTAPGQQFDHELNRCWSMIHRWSLYFIIVFQWFKHIITYNNI